MSPITSHRYSELILDRSTEPKDECEQVSDEYQQAVDMERPAFDDRKQHTDGMSDLISKGDVRSRHYNLSMELAKLFDSNIHELGSPVQGSPPWFLTCLASCC